MTLFAAADLYLLILCTNFRTGRYIDRLLTIDKLLAILHQTGQNSSERLTNTSNLFDIDNFPFCYVFCILFFFFLEKLAQKAVFHKLFTSSKQRRFSTQ